MINGFLFHGKFQKLKHGITEIKCEKNEEFSEIKLHIKPDGAIARFRAFGQYQMMTPPEDELIDMVSIFNAPEITEVTNELVSPAEHLFFQAVELEEKMDG